MRTRIRPLVHSCPVEFGAAPQINGKVWKGALDRAGITEFSCYDLRETWATWPMQNGTLLHELKELAADRSGNELVNKTFSATCDSHGPRENRSPGLLVQQVAIEQHCHIANKQASQRFHVQSLAAERDKPVCD